MLEAAPYRSWAAFAAACCLLAACGHEASPVTAEELPALPELSLGAFSKTEQRTLSDLLGAVRAAPLEPDTNGALARALHANQQYQAAETLYARAAVLEPGALRWRYYLGLVRNEQGRYEEALAAFREAAEIDPDFAPLRRRLGETYLSLDDPARAAAEYERLLKDDPKDPQALFGMGRALALEGEAARSREVLEKAAEAAPAYAAAHYELALAYRDQGDAERSARHLALYESNQQSAPKEDDPLMAAVDAMKRGAGDYIARAIQLEKAGDLDGAIAAHLEALAVDPAVAQTHVNLVALYGRKSDVAKASGHYRKALELASGQADLHYNFGVLMIENGRLAEARQAFEMAIESNPGYAAAYNNLGQIAEREGEIDLAARRYRRALEAQPNFRLARFHLGRMMLAKHSPNEAAEELERAIEPRDEMTPHVLFALAVAREQMGDREGARKLGGQAQQLARQTGQAELARKIGEDLATLR